MKLSFVVVGMLCAHFTFAQATFGYKNPIIPGFHPDPSVCRVENDYYLVNSSFQFFPGVPIFHSRDLIHWQQIGNVLDRPSQLPLKGANAWLGIYAPTIRYNNGIYYVVTTNVGNGNGPKSNFFVTARNPYGPWSEPIWLDQGGIDPSFYFEGDKCYFVSNPEKGISLCEIDPATGKQLSPSVRIWEGDGGRHPEAPHIYKKDGWYYLLIAEGGTEMGHSAAIARSRNITGPYISNPDNPILTHFRKIAQSNPIQGTGHADLVQAHDGSWWLVCLAFRTQANSQHLLGRETYLAPVKWNEDGWPVVNGNGTISLDMQVPTLKQFAVEDKPAVTWFSQMEKLGPEWVFLRNPTEENYRLTPRGLELQVTEIDLNSIESPSFVARRQEDIDFRAQTEVVLENGQDGTESGLTVYMDCSSHYEIYIRQEEEGKYVVALHYRLNALDHVVAEIPVDAGSVTLQVEGSDDMYKFAYSTNGKTFKKIGELNARYLSTETAGGFTGITLGLYATGKSGTAIFRDFTYHSSQRRR